MIVTPAARAHFTRPAQPDLAAPGDGRAPNDMGAFVGRSYPDGHLHQGISRLETRSFRRAPGRVKSANECDGVVERSRLFMKGVCAQFISLLHAFRCRATRKNDHRQWPKLRIRPNIFEHLKTAGIRHDNIEDDEVWPANRMIAAHVDETFQIGNAACRGFSHVPLKWNASLLAGGL